MHTIKKMGMIAAALGLMALGSATASAQDMPPADAGGADNFYKNEKLNMEKVTFENQYKMKVAGNLFTPEGMDRKQRYPAIIVGHPVGAVKEQSANLYAAKMAEQGFVTLAIDLSFWGESEGQPGVVVHLAHAANELFKANGFSGQKGGRVLHARRRHGLVYG